VRFKWRQLEDLLECHDECGRLISEPTFEQLLALGFTRREANRNVRLVAAMRVLRKFYAPLEVSQAPWAVRHRELRAVRDRQLEDHSDDLYEAHTDAMWEAHLEETRTRC
jgi:hypothetical protein